MIADVSIGPGKHRGFKFCRKGAHEIAGGAVPHGAALCAPVVQSLPPPTPQGRGCRTSRLRPFRGWVIRRAKVIFVGSKPNWTLYEGDCLEVMRELPSESVDAVITDPPYGIASATKVQKRGDNSLGSFDLSWDRVLPLDWIEKAARLIRPGGAFVAFTDSNEVGKVREVLKGCGIRPLQNIFWHKTNPPPQPRKNFCSSVEVAVFARKEGRVLYWGGGGATKNIFSAPIVGG